MQILALSTFYHPHEVGGAERSLRILADKLGSHGIVPAIVTIGFHETEIIEDEVDGVRVFRLPGGPLSNLECFYKSAKTSRWLWHLRNEFTLRFHASLEECVRRHRAKLVYISTCAGFSPAAIHRVAHTMGLPIVITCRDYYYLCPRNMLFHYGLSIDSSKASLRLPTMLRRWFLSKADHVVFNSYRTADIYREAVSLRGGSSVIYTPPPGQVPAVSQRRTGCRKFLVIGALTESKGITEFVADWMQFANPQDELIVAGEGKQEGELRRLIEGSSSVTYVGRVDGGEKWRLFSECDVVAVPSRWEEPLPRVVWEAFACERPVLGAAVGGIPEMLGDGMRGYLYNPTSRADLLKALTTMRADPKAMARKVESATSYLAKMRSRDPAEPYARVFRQAVEIPIVRK